MRYLRLVVLAAMLSVTTALAGVAPAEAHGPQVKYHPHLNAYVCPSHRC